MEHTQTLVEQYKCNICGKSCSSARSQTRHIAYCRKSRSRVHSRKKACVICTKAKARCDLAFPKCSRCTTRNLACQYEQLRASRATTGRVSETVGTQTSDQRFSLSEDLTEPLAELCPDQTATSDDVDISSINGCSNSLYQIPSTNIDFADPVSLDTLPWNFKNVYRATTQLEKASVQTVGHNLQTSEPTTDMATSSHTNLPGRGIFDTPLYQHLNTKAPRSFLPRRMSNHRPSLNRRYVLCSLQSYPYMILPGKTPPPFIHPHFSIEGFQNSPVAHDSIPKPLASCAAIIQMFSVKNKNNVTFIWKAIRMEQERLLAECLEYDDATAVAALQALTIYFLLRVSEDNEEATDFDIPLINTMLHVALEATQQVIGYGSPSDDNMPRWKDWVLYESLHRTIIVLFIVNLFFDFVSFLPYQKCQGRLAGLPLPCARDLWRASASTVWEREYRLKGDSMYPQKQLTYGDLMRPRSEEDPTLDSWLGELDDFGALVMAAASLSDLNNV